MSVGALVWTVIGAAWAIWLVLTAVVRGLPGLGALVRAFLGSWTGRVITLAVWGEAGWHLFCQRP